MKILLTLFALTFGAIANATTLQAHVNGMVCAFCAQGIEKRRAHCHRRRTCTST